MARSSVLFPVQWAGLTGGMENSVFTLVDNLEKQGRYRPILACPRGALADAAEDSGVRTKRIGDRAWSELVAERWTWIPRIAVRLRQIVSSCDVQIVHTNTVKGSLFALPSIGRGRADLVYHHRGIGGLSRTSRWLVRWLASSSRASLVPTLEGREFLREIGVASSRIWVVPNPVDPPKDWITRAEARQDLDLDVTAKYVAVIGRAVPYKGLDTALRALAELRRRKGGIEWRMILVASGNHPLNKLYRRDLRELASELEVDNLVTWFDPPIDPWSVYAAADTVWVPSRLEAFGRVAAEAMVAERSLIASTVGGLPLVVRGAHPSVHPEDAEGFADLTIWLHDNPEMRGRMIARAKELVATYRGSTVASGVANIYDRVLG